MTSRRISTRNLQSDDRGVVFDVDVDGRMIRTHISYRRLLDRPATQAERALPAKYLFEGKRDVVQALVDEAMATGWSGAADHMLD